MYLFEILISFQIVVNRTDIKFPPSCKGRNRAAMQPCSESCGLNTCTWRNRIPATPDGRMFGRMKAMTYVMLFSSEEDPEGSGPQYGSFDYWIGFTRHWKRDDTKEPGK